MSDLPADVQQIRQQLQAALEQASQWQQRYEAQSGKSAVNPDPAARSTDGVPAALPPSNPLVTQSLALAIPPEILELTDVTELQRQLAVAQAKISELSQALSQEQANHAKTRQNLTNALADAIENLTRLRQQQSPKTP